MMNFGKTHEGWLHKKDIVTNTFEGAENVFIPPIHPPTRIFRNTYAKYHGLIRQMDQWVGQVVTQLERAGVLEDTFIFYFGDHGGVCPGSKGYIYETGLHVPLVVRIPENFAHLVDLEPGTQANGFVSFVDFGPTLLHLAGLPVPGQMDGRPFMGPGISRADLAGRDETFGMADRFDEKYDLVRSLRKGRFKYLRSYQPFNFDALQNNYRYKAPAYREWRELYEAGKLDEAQSAFFRPREPEALYDVEADPYETQNLAGDPAHAETLVALRTRLSEWVKGLPDLSFYPENYLVREAFDIPVAF
jgi:arylsulfatase A-like enzyme